MNSKRCQHNERFCLSCSFTGMCLIYNLAACESQLTFTLSLYLFLSSYLTKPPLHNAECSTTLVYTCDISSDAHIAHAVQHRPTLHVNTRSLLCHFDAIQTRVKLKRLIHMLNVYHAYDRRVCVCVL